MGKSSSNNRRTEINPGHPFFLFFVLIEMTFGLVHASYSRPEWQAVKCLSLHTASRLTFIFETEK